MSENEYSPYTPLHHESLDDWGLRRGTRVWKASNSFEPVQRLSRGDHVFGVTFSIEDEVVEREGEGAIKQVWRPKLIAREVLGIRAVQARAWQLTFGDAENQYEARRLVAGGETIVDRFPVHHNTGEEYYEQMVDLPTAVDNPRAGSERRKAKRLDREWSQEAGEPKYRPTEFTGMPRGELVTVIPYVSYGGQVGLFDTKTRSYNRYSFTQTHKAIPIEHDVELIQVLVKPDRAEERGIIGDAPPRANMIAQTPFRKEEKTTEVVRDAHADSLDGLDNVEDLDAWDNYVDQIEDPASSPETQEKMTHETTRQGGFYETLQDQELADELSEKYGIEGGFLNGGILIHTALPDDYL
jgi:hypothetical protein